MIKWLKIKPSKFMHLNFHTEKMSNEFEKHHINGLPFPGVIHHFTGVDKGGPHDHPFNFTTHILHGSYVERIYTLTPGNAWTNHVIHRKAGTSHFVPAETIHEIIELPEGECFTLIIPQQKIREPGFWKFSSEGIYFREWNKRFKKIKK